MGSKGTFASPPQAAQVAVKYSLGPRAAFFYFYFGGNIFLLFFSQKRKPLRVLAGRLIANERQSEPHSTRGVEPSRWEVPKGEYSVSLFANIMP